MIISYAYSCAFILQYARHLYYLQEMAPYDEPLRSELLGGKFTILVGGSVSHLVEVCFLIMRCVYKSASNIFQGTSAIQPLPVGWLICISHYHIHPVSCCALWLIIFFGFLMGH